MYLFGLYNSEINILAQRTYAKGGLLFQGHKEDKRDIVTGDISKAK
jgi:hypothetical protein